MGGFDQDSNGWDDHSGPAWSDGGSADGVTEEVPGGHPFRTSEHGRYTHRTMLGWGGMGRVHATRDRRLHRDVAYKQVSAAHGKNSAAAARLAQEAWITAQLEHPNIVPVYDCGESEEGHLFYTMRLIRGRTMQAAQAEAMELSERLTMLRSYLAVCEAMAFAHNEGIVHRDLKPSNVMVGTFGETLVVDWGLARPVGEQSVGTSALPEGHRALTLDGAIVGTAAYMSPEQARSQPPSTTDDVWSLGVMLYELLTGVPAFGGESHEQVLESVRKGVVGDLRAVESQVPAELAAVVQRATATRPEDRYATASGLARDVAAFLDGRWVRAHSYTAWELLVRFVAQWRAPLLVAAIALVVLVAGAGLAFQRTAAERDRAVAAEVESRHTTARMLAGQASRALREGEYADAERMAVASLRLAEVPTARGVLAGTFYPARLSRMLSREIPDCRRMHSSPIADGVLCVREDDMLWLDRTTLQERWRVQGHWDGALVSRETVSARWVGAGEKPAINVNIPTGRTFRDASPAEHFVADGFLVHVGPIPARYVGDEVTWLDVVIPGMGDVHASRTSVVVGSADGLVVIDKDHVVLHDTAGTHLSDMVWANDTEVWATTWGGLLLRLNTLSGQVQQTQLGIGPLVELDVANGLAAVRSETGVVAVFDPELDLQRALVPADSAKAIAFDGEVLHVYSRKLERRFRVPSVPRPGVFSSPGGVTSVGVSPDGRQLAIGGSGGLRTANLLDGRRSVYPWPLERMTLKDLAWTAEGEVVSVGVMFPVKKWTGDPPSAETLTREDVQQSGCCVGRRLAVMADGQVLAATYTAGHSRIYADRVVAPGGPNIGDLEVRADGREAIGISGESNHVLLFDLETWWQAFEHDGDVRSVAISADGQRIAMGGEEQVRVVTREGELLMTLQHTSGSAVDVAWSPDGRWLAMGGYDGTAWLWEGDELRAVFAGHDRQVASLAFLPDSSALVTGSWDSTVRLWTLHAVQAPLSELEPVIEELWGHVAADGSAQP